MRGSAPFKAQHIHPDMMSPVRSLCPPTKQTPIPRAAQLPTTQRFRTLIFYFKHLPKPFPGSFAQTWGTGPTHVPLVPPPPLQLPQPLQLVLLLQHAQALLVLRPQLCPLRLCALELPQQLCPLRLRVPVLPQQLCPLLPLPPLPQQLSLRCSFSRRSISSRCPRVSCTFPEALPGETRRARHRGVAPTTTPHAPRGARRVRNRTRSSGLCSRSLPPLLPPSAARRGPRWPRDRPLVPLRRDGAGAAGPPRLPGGSSPHQPSPTWLRPARGWTREAPQSSQPSSSLARPGSRARGTQGPRAPAPAPPAAPAASGNRGNPAPTGRAELPPGAQPDHPHRARRLR